MEEKKEIKIEGFDDRNIEKQMEKCLKTVRWTELSWIKRSREKRELDINFFNLLVNRINNGLSNLEAELNSIPKKYRKQFMELYENSKKNL